MGEEGKLGIPQRPCKSELRRTRTSPGAHYRWLELRFVESSLRNYRPLSEPAATSLGGRFSLWSRGTYLSDQSRPSHPEPDCDYPLHRKEFDLVLATHSRLQRRLDGFATAAPGSTGLYLGKSLGLRRLRSHTYADQLFNNLFSCACKIPSPV